MDEVPETLHNVSEYGFYERDSQDLKVIGKKSTDQSSKKTYKKDRTE